MTRYKQLYESFALENTCSSCMHFNPKEEGILKCTLWKTTTDQYDIDTVEGWVDAPIEKNECEFWTAKEKSE